MNDLIEQGYIPWDKSWIINLGVLDLYSKYHGHPEYLEHSIGFLRKNYDESGNDLKALEKAIIAWEFDDCVPVYESGALYRKLRILSWILVEEGELDVPKEFVLQGSLVERAESMCNDPDMINWPVKRLLEEEPKTSQRASACYLLERTGKIKNPPYKLQVAYDTRKHWMKKRGKGKCWKPRRDKTILRQFESYQKLWKGEKVEFKSEQAEDFCEEYIVYGSTTSKEGEERWSSLPGHESDRIIETPKVVECIKALEKIYSDDHRVIMAAAKRIKLDNRNMSIEEIQSLFSDPSAVDKSCPRFWDALEYLSSQ